MFENVNEVAVLCAALISVALGSIWYSPLLFGRAWVRAAGIAIPDEDLPTKEVALLALKGVGLHLVFFYIIAQFIFMSRVEAIPITTLGVYLAVLLLSYSMSLIVWEQKTITYFLINGGYGVLVLLVGMGIITLWPW